MSNIARSTAAICAAALLLGSVLTTSGQPSGDYVPDELVVLFGGADRPAITVAEEGFSAAYQQLEQVLESRHVENVRPLYSPRSRIKNVYLLHFSVGTRLDDVSAELRELPFVEAVDKNWLFTVNAAPNDYYFDHDSNSSGELDQWTFYKMQLNRAWEVTKGDDSVIAAIIDTGFDWEHPDLDEGVVWINDGEDTNHNGRFDNYPAASGGDINWVDNDENGYVDDVIGWDFWDWDNDPYPALDDEYSHGTWVGSIVRAETDNNLGIAGATWLTTLMSLRAGAEQSIGLAQALAAINYAIDNGAHVVNMSFSSTGDYPGMHSAIQHGDSLGVLFVGAAGDNNSESARYPGSYAEVVRTAAVDSTLHKIPDSSYGADVDISAPSAVTDANGIVTCWFDTTETATNAGDDPPHLFRFISVKTSGGTAEVTGAMALLRAAYPDSSSSFIKSELFRGAEELPSSAYDGKLGAGMVNPYRSLTKWGVVTADATWGAVSGSSTVYVSGDVTIAEGATLTIEPGTAIKVAREDNEHIGADDDRIEFNIEGELVAVGTPANPIVFDSWNAQSSEDWVGFYLDGESGGATFDNCVIRHAEYAIESWVPLTVRDTEFEDCRYAGVVVQEGGALIEGCTFTDPGTYGIFLTADSTVIRNTTVDGATTRGMHVQPNAGALVVNSQFLNNDWGIYHSGSSRWVNVDSSCVFSGTTAAGIYFYETGVKSSVMRSTIDDNYVGVYFDEVSNSAIVGNEINDNPTGILCFHESGPWISENTITSNTYGVMGAFDGNPDMNGGENTFAFNTYHVGNYTSDTWFGAMQNCWNVNVGDCLPKAGKFDVPNYPYAGVGADEPICCSVSASMLIQLPQPAPAKTVATGLVAIVPNPFNPSTTIRFGLVSQGVVDLRVYDVGGHLVRELVHGTRPAGNHEVVWDGTDRHGSPSASGIYFVRMTASHKSFTKKMALLK